MSDDVIDRLVANVDSARSEAEAAEASLRAARERFDAGQRALAETEFGGYDAYGEHEVSSSESWVRNADEKLSEAESFLAQALAGDFSFLDHALASAQAAFDATTAAVAATESGSPERAQANFDNYYAQQRFEHLQALRNGPPASSEPPPTDAPPADVTDTGHYDDGHGFGWQNAPVASGSSWVNLDDARHAYPTNDQDGGVPPQSPEPTSPPPPAGSELAPGEPQVIADEDSSWQLGQGQPMVTDNETPIDEVPGLPRIGQGQSMVTDNETPIDEVPGLPGVGGSQSMVTDNETPIDEVPGLPGPSRRQQLEGELDRVNRAIREFPAGGENRDLLELYELRNRYEEMLDTSDDSSFEVDDTEDADAGEEVGPDDGEGGNAAAVAAGAGAAAALTSSRTWKIVAGVAGGILAIGGVVLLTSGGGGGSSKHVNAQPAAHAVESRPSPSVAPTAPVSRLSTFAVTAPPDVTWATGSNDHYTLHVESITGCGATPTTAQFEINFTTTLVPANPPTPIVNTNNSAASLAQPDRFYFFQDHVASGEVDFTLQATSPTTITYQVTGSGADSPSPSGSQQLALTATPTTACTP